jgi:hypothetical protein
MTKEDLQSNQNNVVIAPDIEGNEVEWIIVYKRKAQYKKPSFLQDKNEIKQ